MYVDDGGQVRSLAVEPLGLGQVVNPIGSGDAFTAGFTHALVRSQPIEDCVRKGQECGRMNAQLLRPGTIR
jgi:sugar/nucleoside kinase (ribokinase family)